jgi:uncharacterized protein
MSAVLGWLSELWNILAQSGPYLLVGFLAAGLLKVLVPTRWIAQHLGGRNLLAVVKAALVGAPVPLCSCSVIPTAAQLRREGASRGSTTSFLIATPETGVDSIGITWALIDPVMTLARPLAAVATAIGAGVAVNALVPNSEDPPAPAPASDCCQDTCHEEEEQERGGVLRRAAGYAYGPLMADLTPWLLIGFALSALITAAVPDSFFGEVLPSGWPAMGAMLLLGVPMYVCATASTPIAAALMAKGLEPGAALVFLLAGPATNVATIAVLRGLLGGRTLVVYLASIAGFALLAGWIIDLVYSALGQDPSGTLSELSGEVLGPAAHIGGGLLALLLAFHAWRLWIAPRLAARRG